MTLEQPIKNIQSKRQKNKIASNVVVEMATKHQKDKQNRIEMVKPYNLFQQHKFIYETNLFIKSVSTLTNEKILTMNWYGLIDQLQ